MIENCKQIFLSAPNFKLITNSIQEINQNLIMVQINMPKMFLEKSHRKYLAFSNIDIEHEIKGRDKVNS